MSGPRNRLMSNSSWTVSISKVAEQLTVSSAKPVPNDPYVATLSPSEALVGLTPVYRVHEDHYEAFMSGSRPSTPVTGAYLTMHVSIPGTRLPVYGPQNYTTETVAKSLAGGALLIGKTKTIAFALGAPNNGAEVDYLDPWNSRGDGYQTTGGSSTSSGSAVTAYDWVDFAIGSNTGGSVRFPARFWWFVWVQADARLLYFADEPALTQPEAEALKLQFFANVSAALNMSTSSINVTETWLENGPSSGESIASYMTYVYSDQNSIQFYEKIGKDLDARYAACNNGSHFPADPMVNASWYDALNETTIARLPQSVRRRELFAKFWNTNIVKPSNETCSESFFAHSLYIAPGMEKVTYSPPHVASCY
ncbi:hypothetical protein EK21DRAFT_89516 [Setomelanomma holmii]|uniref:Amidase domain-containing protein n=1 Tax=Setomelanomma holmii TaxID=210430 RepID=A0A9P4LLE7_9PLEO|nr:hypothetical protein EK21DRAFT_89516 [Setomelanomma holmii]